jgi:hypothetical protein
LKNNDLKFFPLSLAFLSFVSMCFVILFFTKYSNIDPDHMLGATQFGNMLGYYFLNEYLDFNNSHIFLQLIQLLVVLSSIFILFYFNLIEKRILLIYLLTPFGAYLAVKLKMEFIVVVFSLVRIDLSTKYNLLFILFLAILMILLRENNFIILIFFRICLIFYKKFNGKFLFLLTIIFSVLLNYLFTYLTTIIPLFSRFEWTRDIVNPEYSIVETIGVFISSYHLSFNASIDWKMHLLFSFPLFFYFFLKFVTTYKKQNFNLLFAILGTVLVFTNLTHAFQNARYYFFYIHMLKDILTSKKELIFYFLYGWAHLLILVLYKGF